MNICITCNFEMAHFLVSVIVFKAQAAVAAKLFSYFNSFRVNIGGSNAQRDLFNMFLFYGLAKSDSPLDKERLGQLLGQRQYNGTKSSIADRLMKRYLHQPRLEIVAS
ncbi:unnamed protein product [Protopolystoma xenopodis]|uniref:Uncharacterized protein n=1 Tax=Protopolystoma xenopodis TaxID=117903 RepID=A0A448WRL5_9PLAT|nr:unnamed protein product [Protopolystoma xenopodis]